MRLARDDLRGSGNAAAPVTHEVPEITVYRPWIESNLLSKEYIAAYLKLKRYVFRYRVLRLRAPQFAGEWELVYGARNDAGDVYDETSEAAYRMVRAWNPAEEERAAREPWFQVYAVRTESVHGYAGRIKETVREILALNPPPAVAAWAAHSAAEAEKILEGGTDDFLAGDGAGEDLRVAYADLAYEVLACLRVAYSDAERGLLANAAAACTPRRATSRDAARAPHAALTEIAMRALRAMRATLSACLGRRAPPPAHEAERLAP